MTIESIAKLCHEANREFCASIGDASQKPWEEAPQWQKDSVIVGIQTLLRYPDFNAEDLHQAWVDHKAESGWVFGPRKDETAKTHPCMIAYGELPVAQKSKDLLFIAMVRACEPFISE